MMPQAVQIELDRPRHLRYDFNALVDIEDAIGKPLTAMEGGLGGLRELRALLWAGLKCEDRSLTLRATGDLIQQYLERGGDQAELAQAIDKALRQSGLFRSPEGQAGN